jgi:hypothetical protein
MWSSPPQEFEVAAADPGVEAQVSLMRSNRGTVVPGSVVKRRPGLGARVSPMSLRVAVRDPLSDMTIPRLQSSLM